MRGFNTGGMRRATSALSVAILMTAAMVGLVPGTTANAAVVSGTVTYTVLASSDANGNQPAGEQASRAGVLSSNGQYVAFVSNAPLVAADTNGTADVYRKNLTSGAVDWVSANANGSSDSPYVAISDSGDIVVFSSDATNLVPGDVNGQTDIFRKNLSNGVIDLVNISDDETEISPDSMWYSVSADGNEVAFYSSIGMLAGGAGNPGVYIRNNLGQTVFVHEATPGPVAISGNGRVVVYQWDSPLSSAFAIYLTDRDDATISAYNLHYGISVNNGDPIGLLGPDSISNDGNIVTFWADGNAYPPSAVQPRPRAVYAYNHAARKANNDFYTQQMVRMSEVPDGPDADTEADDGNADSAAGFTYPKGAVSADGSKVAFFTAATNLGDTANGALVVRERTTSSIVAHSLDHNFVAKPVFDGGISPNGNSVVFTASAEMSANDVNGNYDVWVRSTSAPLTPPAASPTNVSLTPTLSATLPGFTGLDSADVPPSALPLDALGDVAGAPLRSIDLAATPLRSIPLRSIPLRSIPLRSIPLRSITLSELPLADGTWEAILATIPGQPYKGVPLQAITLDEVLAANPPSLGDVTLGDVDLASTPLRSISVASIMLGAIPLRSIPVGGDINTAFTDWCSALAGLGYSCADLGLTQDSSVLAVDLAGVPLRSIPLRSIPLRSIPLRSIDTASAPLRSIPLRSIQYGGELGSMPLDAIKNLNGDGTLSTTSNPGLLVNCALLSGGTCTGRTLTDATTANAFLDGKTLGDLIDHVDPAALTGSLGELIAAVINTSNYPWESLPLDGLQEFAGTGARSVEWTAAFDVAGTGTGTATISVDLPPGFQYKRFSTVNHDDNYAEPTVTGQHLVWTQPVTGGESHAIVFDAYAPFDLAIDSPSRIMVSLNGFIEAADGSPIDVFEDMEFAPITSFDSIAFVPGGTTNNNPASAPIIPTDTLIASHIGYSGDVDYYRLPVPPKGTRIQIRLGNHSTDADFDVAMLNSTTDATPLRSIPLRSIPLRSIPLTDNGVDATAADSSVSPETLNDIPNVNSTPLRSIGENRGTADEFIATVSDAEPIGVPPPGGEFGSPQYYTLQVTAYNGGWSKAPYVLYVDQYAPPPPPECPAPKAYPNAGAGVLGTVPSSLPANLNTLFLVDKKRMGDTFGATAAQNVIDKLNTLAGRSDLGVTGVVYPVDGNSSVNQKLIDWDDDPCDVELANRAFTAIAGVVDSVRAERPTLKNIVVVGGDDILPMARVADYTQISNESDYGSALLLAGGGNDGTPIAAAAITQNILTDDPLGDVDPIPWLDHTLYVPDLAVGRMVETPAEIMAQVDSFIASNGRLDPQRSLTTGYDFLADGAEGVDQALANGITDATKRSKLINETWAKADVLAALFPATNAPDIATVNAHYDHTRSLPALGNSTADETDLVTTAEIAANPLLTKKLLFTMGCHAGLSVPKAYTNAGTAAKDADWAQTYSARGAAVYFANTGFGYGDTAAVALSEELMRQFAGRLNGSMTVGEAAVYAKQAYFGQLGAYGPYDEKAMQEATFYGLPMWKIGDGTNVPPAPTNITPVVDATGVKSAPVSIAPSFTQKTSKGGGTYFQATAANAAASGLQVTQYRPVEPRLSVDVTPEAGHGDAHGVLITDLASHDAAVVPAMARPVIDLTANEPAPPAGDVSFPTTFQNLSTFNSPSGERQHVVFLPGQFFRDSGWANAGGVQRLFDEIGAEVKYSDSDDWLAPHLTNVSANLDAGTLTITLTSFDESEDGVKRVLVLVKDESGEWTRHEAVPGTGPDQYQVVITGVVGTQFEYFAQAQDGAGNVGVTTNKGRYFTGIPAALTDNGTPNLALSPGQPTGTNGWYKSNVNVVLQGTPGVTYTKEVDGGAPVAYSGPHTFTTDGSHSVKAVGSDGSSDQVVVVVDKTNPVIGVVPTTSPNANGWYKSDVTIDVTCSDATSGIQVCPPDQTVKTETAGLPLTAFDFAGNSASGPTIKLDKTSPTLTIAGVTEGAEYTQMPTPSCTAFDSLSGPDGCTGVIQGGSVPGMYMYVATAKDKAGNTFTKIVNFKLVYIFSGFMQPINDTGHQINSNTSIFGAGSTVPFRFQLTKPDGTVVQAQSGAPVFLTPKKLGPLGSSVSINEQQPLEVPSSGFEFSFDGKVYHYNWKTDKKKHGGFYWQVGVLVDGKQYTVIVGLR